MIQRIDRLLRHADEFLIGKFESFTHWTQQSFGITSPIWMQFSLVCAVLFLLKEMTTESGMQFGLSTLAMLGIGVSFIYSEIKRCRPDSYEFINPAKEFSVIRISGAMIAITTLPSDLINLTMWFQFAFAEMYFAACNDLPPGESKLRKWLNSFRSTPATVTESA